MKVGDILQCTESMIVHQTNCQGVMGSGLAKQIKDKYPEVYQTYLFHCKTNIPQNLLGTSLICEANDGKYIANVFGQFSFGQGLQTDYAALKNALKEVYAFALQNNLSVAFPYKIGCGLGGGDWNIVFDIINEVFYGPVPFDIYKLEEFTQKI